MYTFRHSNPKLCGYIYTRKKKCGKANCRCAKNDKHRHTSYQLQYREWINGKWVRRSEYVPRSQVRTLRARIRRAKKKDLEMQQTTRDFFSKMPKLIRRIQKNPCDVVALDNAKKLVKSLNSKAHFLTRLQIWQRVNILVNLLCAMLNPHQQELT